MYYTLTSLGLPSSSIKVHMLSKASSVFQPSEKAAMESYGATRFIFLDQGSRGGPPLVSPFTNTTSPIPDEDSDSGIQSVCTLILDHHESDEFPAGTLAVSACRSPPIATSSLLTYIVCEPLHESIRTECAIPALLGVFGDLGPSEVKWGQKPWPGYLGEVVKQITKKAISEAVSAMNAPRRTADFKGNRDTILLLTVYFISPNLRKKNVNIVYEAWEAVLRAKTLQDISNNRSFLEARQKVNAEVERCTHTAPAFSRDRRVALLTIKSGFQVHPVIATRWAGYLRARGLQLVMVANEGYHPSGQHTNFSCRIIASLRRLPENERPNLIEILKDYSREVPDEGFLERVEGDFAKGHKEASGGIILSVSCVRASAVS